MEKHTLDELIFYGLALFACSVIFSVTVVEAALFLVLALVLARKYREGSLSGLRPALTGHPLFIPWLLYLGVCLLTSLTAYFPLKGLGQLNSDFLKYVCLFTLLLAVKKEQLPALARFYVAAAALGAVIGLAQVADLFPSVYDAATVRANALMNAVRYSEIMVIAMALALAKVLLPAPADPRKERFFYGAAAGAIFLAVVFSQTRGAYMGLAALMLCLLLFGKGFRRRTLAAAFVLLAAGAAASALNPAIARRLTAAATQPRAGAIEYVAINTRKELWKTGYRMLKAHPVLGIGPDNVKPLFTVFHPELIEEKKWGSLHSIYIHQAAERGLAGLGVLLLLFLSMFLFALRRYEAESGPYTLWALCALPAYYVMNLTEISFQHVHTAFAVFLALAFAAAADNRKV